MKQTTKPISDCYGCMGTGKIVGFGHDGSRCLCLDRNYCSECGYDTGVEREEPGDYLICRDCEGVA